jgi:hypothetical protein
MRRPDVVHSGRKIREELPVIRPGSLANVNDPLRETDLAHQFIFERAPLHLPQRVVPRSVLRRKQATVRHY